MRDINDKVNNNGVTPEGQYPAEEFNSLKNEQANAVERSGQTLDAGSVLQLAESLFLHGAKSTAFQSGGTANAVTLVPISGANGVKIPADYANMGGVRAVFRATVANTGAVTIDIGQTTGTLLGTKDLRQIDGSALTGGEISDSLESEIRFNAVADYWELLPWSLPASQLTLPLSLANGGTGATNIGDARNNLEVPPRTRNIATSGLASGGGTLESDRTVQVNASSQAQAEGGTDNTTAMTPLRVAQAIAALTSSGFSGLQTFTTPGPATWNKPVGVSRILFFATGAGGQGGNIPATPTSQIVVSGGGGAGGTVMGFLDVSSISSLAIDIGQATGGITSENTTIDNGGTNIATANGGALGTGLFTGLNVGGDGGNASIGGGAVGVAVKGSGGGNASGSDVIGTGGQFARSFLGGSGGASFWGSAGKGALVRPTATTSSEAGVFGSGGGGGAVDGGSAGDPSESPSSGGNGVVVILEFA